MWYSQDALWYVYYNVLDTLTLAMDISVVFCM